MRTFGSDTLPEHGELVLLTVKDIGPSSRPMVADFRDHMALAFKPAKAFMGLDASGDMRIGRGPAKMRDGVWYIRQDADLEARWPNVTIVADDLDFKPIL